MRSGVYLAGGLFMRKVAIITGAGRGIGFEIAHRLGTDGMKVVLAATSPIERYKENFALLTSEQISWIYVQADISKGADRQKLVEKALNAYGAIHVLVNNAGVAPAERRDLLEMTEESFDRVMGINTKGTMFLTQLVSKQMLKQPYEGGIRGSIINISSCSAEVSSVNRGEYCVSKAGVSMLTSLYADRLAKEGVLVNEIRPGVIVTDMTKAAKEKYDRLISGGMFPLSRWGTTEDVASAVSAFAKGYFPYTTGSYIDVDGGFHIKRL